MWRIGCDGLKAAGNRCVRSLALSGHGDEGWCTRSTEVLALMMALAVLSGCSTKTVYWTEEVELSDGRIVEVERRERHKDMTPIGGPTTALPVRISFRVLGQNPPAPEWVDQLQPILLDVDPENGEYVLICTTSYETVWRPNGSPNPPYWQFRLHDGTWISQPVQESYFGRATNLVLDAGWVEDSGQVVTLTTKREWRNQHNTFKRYVSINRESRFGMN